MQPDTIQARVSGSLSNMRAGPRPTPYKRATLLQPSGGLLSIAYLVANLFSPAARIRIHPTGDSSGSRPMAVVALKQKPTLKTFHATVHVTRVEQWCVEAETAEEARELLAAGAGHRCEIGDCVNVEVGHVED